MRASNRRFLNLGVPLIALALVAGACTGTSDTGDDAAAPATTAAAAAAPDTAAPPDEGGPKYGGTLRVALVADTHTLDPAISVSAVTTAITQHVYDNLLMIQPDLTMKPELATSWEANEDLTSYTFYLREGVKFHHGKDFSAEDVVFTFNRLLDPELDSPLRAILDIIEEIVVIDDFTVRFDLDGPNGYFPSYLQKSEARILPADIDLDQLVLGAIGTGPFILDEHLPGERITMVRNPNYWEEGRPYLDEIVFVNIPEPAGRVNALLAGDVDLIQHGMAPLSVPEIDGHPDTRVLVLEGWGWLGLAMDNARPPFDNKLVRQAFQAATDRELVNQAALLGLGAPGYDHPIGKSNAVFASQFAPPPYDPELARQLLAEAGYPDGIDIDLHTADITTGAMDIAVAFKESAAPAGIRVNVVVNPSAGFWDSVWQKETLTIDAWRGADPDQALSEQFHSASPYNAPHYVNPEVDALIEKAKGQDLAGQQETYAEVQRILIEDVPAIVAAFRPELIAVQNYVQGVSPHPLSWPLFQDAWLDLDN